jgi:hypothetical protein
MNNIELYIKGIRKDKQHPERKPDYIDRVVLAFLTVFTDYEVLNRGMESSSYIR